jgi:hypothetical protein
MATRPEQLADAYEAIAHMVGIVGTVTACELDAAEQILIIRQNEGKQSGARYKRLDLALNLIESVRKGSFIF